MNLKAILTTIVAATAAVTMSACAPQLIQLDETANGKIIECSKGDKIEIRLPGNATTGYMWTLERVPADTVLVKTNEQYLIIENNRKMVGAPGIALFNFEVTGTGSEGIRLVYQRPWEKNKSEGTFEVLVNSR